MDQNKDNSGKKRGRKNKQEEVNSLIQQAMQSHLLEYADKKNSKQRSLDEVIDMVQEHLGSFIIIGYTYNGEPLSSVVSNTQQETDSLCTLINRFLIQNSSM
tara:strand:- start:708 stop:1013 length:306 start_codon:yes stop_codon:yes gene_type:complete